ncbi:transferase family-domain-containing protein [Exophiala viscosa]|uniref:Transferase family-domain-containing protein n=1 Tax=Exophiala viscosa TaxID=2486360 RepID=A0AAN6E2F1_9EURO|nr:transferase family-domain-containing protein [Exophiala viscosa]KAI1629500.1 transferase family-domain-containing protein [Exophiala viscosa]
MHRDGGGHAAPRSSEDHVDLADTGLLRLHREKSAPGTDEHVKWQHSINLSSIEHCMPRSYIRICLAYRLPSRDMLLEIQIKLNNFVRKTVDAKPYLSGFVVAVKEPNKQVGAVKIKFSDQDFLEYPMVKIRHLSQQEVPYTYDQLNEMGMPPSVLKPDLVSALTESADDERAPVFRVQANVVEGGLIVSIYLHHCISDGTGFALLTTGSLLNDDFTFERHLDGKGHGMPSLSRRLDAFAHHQSIVRQELSYNSPNQINDRHLKCKVIKPAGELNEGSKAKGRGCIMSLSLEKLAGLKSALEGHTDGKFITQNDALLALLWHSMTKARIPSLASGPSLVTESKLLIPVNIRNKLKKPLSESYFGAAVDFASAKMRLSDLALFSNAALALSAMVIREAINNVDEPYIRQAIALARYVDPKVDVRDLQASNMDRSTGADMYVTSWEKLRCYDATFEMGLGRPDWIRKPWSKDPGSCIVLPRDDQKPYLEVVIQMTEGDMARLLDDKDFMSHVSRVID